MNLANEGLEARKKEEEVSAKKRKAEDDARWEGELGVRVCTRDLTNVLRRKPRTACRQLAEFHQHKQEKEEIKGRCAGLELRSFN